MLRVYVNSNICYRSRFAKSTRQTMYKIPQFALRVESQRVVLCRSYLFLRPAVTASTPGHNGASEFPHPEFSDPQFISGVPLQTRTPPRTNTERTHMSRRGSGSHVPRWSWYSHLLLLRLRLSERTQQLLQGSPRVQRSSVTFQR